MGGTYVVSKDLMRLQQGVVSPPWKSLLKLFLRSVDKGQWILKYGLLQRPKRITS